MSKYNFVNDSHVQVYIYDLYIFGGSSLFVQTYLAFVQKSIILLLLDSACACISTIANEQCPQQGRFLSILCKSGMRITVAMNVESVAL